MTPESNPRVPEREFVALTKMRVASPCKAEWRWMYGDDRVRFCGQCRKNVYDLSAMTQDEAEELVRKTEGHLCVRFYRREDGTILTQNCPVGLRALKRHLSRLYAAASTALLGFLANVALVQWVSRPNAEERVMPVFVMDREAAPQGAALMGKIVRVADLTTVKRSEGFLRQNAVFKVTPVIHSTPAIPVGSSGVVVDVIISKSGDVLSAVCSKGAPDLQGLAEDAAYRWRFKPMREKGDPVQVESTLTFSFGR